jgi:hypothetical protein
VEQFALNCCQAGLVFALKCCHAGVVCCHAFKQSITSTPIMMFEESGLGAAVFLANGVAGFVGYFYAAFCGAIVAAVREA